MIPRGRVLLEEELNLISPGEWRGEMDELLKKGFARIEPGVDILKKRCNRCGGNQLTFTECGTCKQTCAYCPACLQMGRSKRCSNLYYILDEERIAEMPAAPLLAWKGQLSSAQLEASNAAKEIVRGLNQKLLIWAVCGAGKTEVVFGPIDRAISLGQKVMLVTPRKDVVLELLPRLQKAFPQIKIIALHGKSTQKWEEAELTLSTTHQALRFYQKFDLVIIDEVDAFPYHNNPMLYFAVDRAKKTQGNLIYLSATPPAYLRKIQQVRIPARYHRKPLAIPKIIIEKHLLKKGAEPIPVLKQIVEYWNKNQRQGFVFVPFIELVDVLVNQLTNFTSVVGTHSRDPKREEKVMQFRKGEVKVIVTTTILERGVTVPRTDVVIFQAEAPIFDEASLVQMSGRAGRSLEDPIGHVIFLASEKTKEMKKAIKHIQQMNKLAKKKGMIDQ